MVSPLAVCLSLLSIFMGFHGTKKESKRSPTFL